MSQPYKWQEVTDSRRQAAGCTVRRDRTKSGTLWRRQTPRSTGTRSWSTPPALKSKVLDKDPAFRTLGEPHRYGVAALAANMMANDRRSQVAAAGAGARFIRHVVE